MQTPYLRALRNFWLSPVSASLCLSALAQSPLPAGNPIDTLPRAAQPPQAFTASPAQSTPTLTTSQALQPTQPLQQAVQVRSIQIAGVHAVPFATIAALFEPLTGQTTTIAALAQAVAQATQVYQQAGFPLSFAYLPEQSFDHGIVHVTVVEGHINRVVLEGDTGKSAPLLQAIAEPLKAVQPLTQAAFDRQTLLLARLSHIQVSASAALPTTTDGGTPLLLKLERNPALLSLGADVRQGDPKAVATLTLNEPLWGGSQWQFSALIDNWSKERFTSATLIQALNPQGTVLSINASDFKGRDNFASNQLQDTTSQRKLNIDISHPLHLSSTGSSIIGAALYGVNYQKHYDFAQQALVLLDQEKVRALQAHWSWQKLQAQTQQSARAAFTQGMQAMGAGLERSALLASNPAKLSFSKFTLDYTVRWRAASLWGAGFGIGGQATPHTLPTSERISFGGSNFGRGYRSGEAAGDQGLGASLELNRQFPLPQGQWLQSVEPYLLYEQARTWFHQSNWPSQKLQSTSAGLRLSDNKHYALDVAVSKPHGDPSPYNPQKKLRYSLLLTYQLNP